MGILGKLSEGLSCEFRKLDEDDAEATGRPASPSVKRSVQKTFGMSVEEVADTSGEDKRMRCEVRDGIDEENRCKSADTGAE